MTTTATATRTTTMTTGAGVDRGWQGLRQRCISRPGTFFFSSFFLHFTNDYIQVGYGYATAVPSLLLWCIQGPPQHVQTTLTCQNPKGNTLTGTTGRRRSAEMDTGLRHVKTCLKPQVSFFFCFFSFFIYFTNDFFITYRLCVTENKHWHPSVPQLPFFGIKTCLWTRLEPGTFFYW